MASRLLTTGDMKVKIENTCDSTVLAIVDKVTGIGTLPIVTVDPSKGSLQEQITDFLFDNFGLDVSPLAFSLDGNIAVFTMKDYSKLVQCLHYAIRLFCKEYRYVRLYEDSELYRVTIAG